MTQNRVWWGASSLGIKADGSVGGYTTVHGLQSMGTSTKIDIKKIFEHGQSETYDFYEELPEVELTAERVFDGYPILYHLATPNATNATLLGRSNAKCIAVIHTFPDTSDSASGTSLSSLTMSGMFVNSWNATFDVGGEAKESCTFVGNNKAWGTFTGTVFDNTDSPLAGNALGNVQHRQNVIFDVADAALTTILPTQIPGISSSGTNFLIGGTRKTHVQKITVSADFGREAMNELGQKKPYHRYMNLPVDVKTDIEIMALSGDMISVSDSASSNTINETIRVVLQEGLNVYLGTRNRLTNVQYGGDDAGGGNATITYSYTNANQLTIKHPQDPAGL